MSIADDIAKALDLDAKATKGPWAWKSETGEVSTSPSDANLELIAIYRDLAPRLAAWAQQVMPLVEAAERVKKLYDDDDAAYDDATYALIRIARTLNLEVPR